MSLTVPSYTGQSQPSQIQVPARISYQEVWEEGPWSMPPYATFYPPPPEPEPAKISLYQPIFGQSAKQAFLDARAAANAPDQ